MSATYRESRAPGPLGPHACCVWSHVAGPGGHVERVLPDGCADVVWIDGEGIVVAGPATREVLVAIPAGGAALGVRFGPGAAGAALGVAARELRDRTVALEDVWGAPATELAERLSTAPRASRLSVLAAAFAQRLDGARAPNALVARASGALAAGLPVAAASREVALTDRHLRRRFHDAVGYGRRRCSACCACAASWPSPRPSRTLTSPAPPRRRATPTSRTSRASAPTWRACLRRRCWPRALLPDGRLNGRRSRNGSASPGSSSSATRSASPISTSCTSWCWWPEAVVAVRVASPARRWKNERSTFQPMMPSAASTQRRRTSEPLLATRRP